MSDRHNKPNLLQILRKVPTRQQEVPTKRAPPPVVRRPRILPFSANHAAWPEVEDVSSLLRKAPKLITPRRGEALIHVSTLLSGCLRQVVLSALYKISPPAEAPIHALSLIFAYGNAVHSFVQMSLAKVSSDRMYGKWTCKCETMTLGPCTLAQVPADAVCIACGSQPDRYVELFLRDEVAGFGGTPDLLLLCNGGKVQVTEIKSSSDKKWNELNAPEPTHALQAALYRELVRRNDKPVSDHFTVLYAVKNRGMQWPYKEFVEDAAPYERRVASYIDLAVEAKQAIHEGGKLPDRVCSSADCSRAKTCHVASLCFGLER